MADANMFDFNFEEITDFDGTDVANESTNESDDNLFESAYDELDESDEDLFEEDDKEDIKEEEAKESKEADELLSIALAELSDEAEIAIGDTKLTKAELSSLVAIDKELKEVYTNLSSFSNAMEEQAIQAKTKYYAATLECDKQIEAIQRRMNDPMTNPSEKGNLYSHYQQLEARKQVINKEAEAYLGDITNARTESLRQRYQVMNAAMAKDTPNWAEEGSKVQQYLMGSGMPEMDIHNAVSPAFAKLVLKAMKYDELNGKNKAIVEGKLKGKKQAPLGKSQRTSNATKSKAASVKAKLDRGEAVDSSAMFDFLED